MMDKVRYGSVLLAFFLSWHCIDGRGGRREFYAESAVNASTARSALHEIARSPVIPPLYDDLLYALGDVARPCRSAREEVFRRIDGTCNNLNDPLRGAVLDTEKRLFPNAYLDGRSFPRTRGVDFSELPSAREVSRRWFGSEEDGDGPGIKNATQLIWLFGQAIAHDISLVDTLQGVDNCCEEFKPCQDHPDLHRENGVCFPIETLNDTVFDSDCMPFARSFGVELYDVRELVNAVTSYLDASFIYGSSEMQSDALRLHSQGLLRTRDNNLLPVGGVDHVICPRDALRTISDCPVSGDIRVNDHPGLGAIHSLFHLEHNRIARHLFQLNRLWDDEMLFQVTRKIAIAIFQKITYEDFLPIVLGNEVMEIFDLNKPYEYQDTGDANARLEFSTATFRFGHTLINSHVNNDRLNRQFFVPIEEERDIPDILFSQARSAPLEYDNRFTDEIRELFYANVTIPNVVPEGVSFDLPARNIQRGRDHGIPTYPVVRDECRRLLWGLPGVIQSPPTFFTDGVVYRDEADIDLFPGGISETPLPNALIGPTFACINAIQFQQLKFGDRFFYESSDIEGFTDEQREMISRNTLATLMCELAPNESLQRNVFRPESNRQHIVYPPMGQAISIRSRHR